MRQIINGRRYDTGTATRIGEVGNGYPSGDPYYLDETL
jgi:hypothetical protein